MSDRVSERIIAMNEKRSNLLRVIQDGLPIEKEPFQSIASIIDLPQKEVMDIIKNLKKEKIIRQISPIYNTRALGYDSSLVAFNVLPEKIEEVVNFVNAHPGVSHNYERNHRFNLWFTLTLHPDSSLGLEGTVMLMAQRTEVREYVILRSKRIFKIGVKLDMQEDNGTTDNGERVSGNDGGKYKINSISDGDKEIIRITQSDLPIVERPFYEYVSLLGIDENLLLDKLKEFREKGIMRRFAAVLYHRNLGFKANGMVAWQVPEEEVEEVGNILAKFMHVSHCYERETNKYWRYNLFTMIHGKTEKEVEDVVRGMIEKAGNYEHLILYSTREFKKCRIRYFDEEFYKWEACEGLLTDPPPSFHHGWSSISTITS
jgi:DNA-binding Lrp family transcriptional regulator